MLETVEMTVELSLRDIRSFIFGEYYSRIKGTIIIYGALAVILFSLVLFASMRILDWLLFAAAFLVLIALLLAVSLLQPFMQYLVIAAGLKKQKSFTLPHRYEFSGQSIAAAFAGESQTYQWHYIFKVDEYRAGFNIYTSPEHYLIIPRRCFTSPAQLALFYTLIALNVSHAKLNLKNPENLKAAAPPQTATLSQAAAPPASSPAAPAQAPLAEITFQLTKAEFTAFYYKRLYASPVGIFAVLIGLAFLSLGLTSNNLINLITWTTVGSAGLLATPIHLYFKTIKPLSNDPNIMKPVTYRFYPDTLVSDAYADATLRTPWYEVRRVTQTKTAYTLYHNKTAHLIPKRAFDEKPEALAVFLKLSGKE